MSASPICQPYIPEMMAATVSLRLPFFALALSFSLRAFLENRNVVARDGHPRSLFSSLSD